MIRFWLLLLLGAHAAAQQQPVPFSHKIHAGAMKLACKTCHPNPDPGETVAERDQLVKEADLSMGGCMQCHTARKASLDCALCHELPGQ